MSAALTDDDAFLEAEREIPRVRQERKRVSDGSDAQNKPFFDRLNSLEKSIDVSPPVSLTSAAVKLRHLLDPNLGLDGLNPPEETSLKQILAFIEREAQRGAK